MDWRSSARFPKPLDNAACNELASVGPNLLRNPKLLAAQIENILEKPYPSISSPLSNRECETARSEPSIQGSLGSPGDSHQYLAKPEVIEASPEMMLHKVRFFDEILKGLGLTCSMSKCINDTRNCFECQREKSAKKTKLPKGALFSHLFIPTVGMNR